MVIAIWGTGHTADQLFNLVDKTDGIERDDIRFCCDNNVEKQGKLFHGTPVVSPLELMKKDIDFLVIASAFHAEIRKQISKEKIISDEKVVSFHTYEQLLFTRLQYYKKYGERLQEIPTKPNSDSIIVYTAITGDYDNLNDPLFTDDDIRYVCVTDNKNIRSDVWKIIYVEDINTSNVMLARRIKILPWEYFDFCGTVVWIDANLPVRSDIRSFINKYMTDRGMLCFPHSERCCIYNETAAVISHRPEIKREVILQAADYIHKGMPADYGLYETGCMARNFENPLIKELMIDWWSQLTKYTYRDQISLPYVCWKNGFSPDICDQSIWMNEWLGANKHNN